MPLSETNRYTYNLNLLNGYNQHFQVHHYSPDFFFIYLFLFLFIIISISYSIIIMSTRSIIKK